MDGARNIVDRIQNLTRMMLIRNTLKTGWTKIAAEMSLLGVRLRD